jgi:hypothetical protein
MAPEAARSLAEGRRFADSLETALRDAPTEAIGVSAAIAAGYLERHRLGLGSPFRLIEMARRDPLLKVSMRSKVGYALLARSLMFDGYAAPPATLDVITPESPTAAAVPGEWHRAIIDSTVFDARDPRVGELTVRLGYRLAASAARVSRRGATIAAHAGALARDRVLAQRDVRNLLAQAKREQVDPLSVVPLWRAERRFAVERPVLDEIDANAERTVMEAAVRLAAKLESAGDPQRSASIGFNATRDAEGIGEGAARRLAGLAQVRSAPPQAAVTVAVNGYRAVIDGYTGDRSARSAALWFGEHARNEESLAAAYALFAARDTTRANGVPLATLWAAVSLRTLAQEPIWMPGDGGPSASDLLARFGLSSISFDETVPAGWRPYYRRMLSLALTDLRRVLPALGVRGLAVHFGESPMREEALALHDPATRTMYLPLSTGAGVIAHEIAHDLDWQTARAKYGRSHRGYRTDRAVREFASESRLAAAMLELAAAGLGAQSAAASSPSAPSRRPTEILARNVDWFVAAALAHEGRMNGFLSAVQDGLLSGWAAVGTPEVSRQSGEAVMRALDAMTFVPPDTRTWFAATYGRGRAVSSYELVRRVLDAPITFEDVRAMEQGDDDLPPWSAYRVMRSVATTGVHASACLLQRDLVRDEKVRAGREALVMAAAEARARGVVRRRIAYGDARSGMPWRARSLAGVPWQPALAEASVARLRDLILHRAEASESAGAAAVLRATPLGGCVNE